MLSMEHKKAHDALIANFNGRVEARRKNHPDEQSWVIPFSYDWDEPDNDDYFEIQSGLWIPPDNVQTVTNMLPYYHMSAAVAMEGELSQFGIRTHDQRCNSLINIEPVIPIVSIPRYMTNIAHRQLQIERDFGVQIEFEN